jgi:hypothetical protein
MDRLSAGRSTLARSPLESPAANSGAYLGLAKQNISDSPEPLVSKRPQVCRAQVAMLLEMNCQLTGGVALPPARQREQPNFSRA